ncbi:MAG: hypothetical protein ACI9S8_001690 [Chlamydiales bacterium]|jgi:hypothetical protein
MQYERKILEEKIKLYDVSRIAYGFGEGFVPGAIGAVVENVLLGAIIPSDNMIVIEEEVASSNLGLPDSPELLEVEFEKEES